MSAFNMINYILTHTLTKDNKLNAITRFIQWQIGGRLSPGETVYDWINGSKFIVRPGDVGLTGNIYTGLHEFQDMAFLLHFLREDDLFIDVGANLGSYTILACSAIGASGYAFEPIPGTYERLVENIRLNHIEDRVKCLNIGVGREVGNIVFTSDLDTTNHALAPGEECDNVIYVDVSTLDKVLENESPSLIKIDAEGYEFPVLEGAANILKKQSLNSIIMELNGSGLKYGFDESLILEMMFDCGFNTYSYNPLDRSLSVINGNNLKSGNILFIRDKKKVLDKLKSSPNISVHGKNF